MYVYKTGVKSLLRFGLCVIEIQLNLPILALSKVM